MTAQDGAPGDSAAGERVAIGISFGNSNSSIAYTTGEGKAQVIANEEGDRQIPSIFSYIGGEEYHGSQAKSYLVRNSQNTVTNFRDFLGKDFKSIDPTPCHASAHPQESDSTIVFPLQESDSDEGSNVSVSKITGRHLARLVASASDYLGKTVNAAVITIPTDFTQEQRDAITSAAKGIQLEVLQLIHEPVSAILAYDARPGAGVSDKNIVVADLGGTRSDVAVIASRGGMYTILATAHDYSLGGVQLDQVLVDFFAKEFIKKHKADPRANARSLAKLSLEAEATKKTLSLGTTASLSVESLAEGIDFTSTINRTRYDLLGSKVFSSFTQLVQSAVQKAELDPLDISTVVCSGGTSHTPKVARLLQSAFPPTTTVLAPSTSPTAINPSELAARGAAIQASLIQEFDHEDIEQSTHPMVTVAPHLAHPVGVLLISSSSSDKSTAGAPFHPLLPAQTAVPARRSAQVPAPKDGGDVLVTLCEGIRQIDVTKSEPKTKSNPADGTDSDTSEDDDDESDDEEDIRSLVWKPGTVLAEAAVKAVGKGKKIEIVVSVGGDLSVVLTAREVGGKGGVRGNISPPDRRNSQTQENGSI
ncbi:MAG: Hsp70 protein that interacts with Zuo1p [Piccolia ochrophora]|nr:MAG: Hsp70 protein that interacts with Zuo1p [Piccolia ochrophora]